MPYLPPKPTEEAILAKEAAEARAEALRANPNLPPDYQPKTRSSISKKELNRLEMDREDWKDQREVYDREMECLGELDDHIDETVWVEYKVLLYDIYGVRQRIRRLKKLVGVTD